MAIRLKNDWKAHGNNPTARRMADWMNTVADLFNFATVPSGGTAQPTERGFQIEVDGGGGEGDDPLYEAIAVATWNTDPVDPEVPEGPTHDRWEVDLQRVNLNGTLDAESEVMRLAVGVVSDHAPVEQGDRCIVLLAADGERVAVPTDRRRLVSFDLVQTGATTADIVSGRVYFGGQSWAFSSGIDFTTNTHFWLPIDGKEGGGMVSGPSAGTSFPGSALIVPLYEFGTAGDFSTLKYRRRGDAVIEIINQSAQGTIRSLDRHTYGLEISNWHHTGVLSQVPTNADKMVFRQQTTSPVNQFPLRYSTFQNLIDYVVAHPDILSAITAEAEKFDGFDTTTPNARRQHGNLRDIQDKSVGDDHRGNFDAHPGGAPHPYLHLLAGAARNKCSGAIGDTAGENSILPGVRTLVRTVEGGTAVSVDWQACKATGDVESLDWSTQQGIIADVPTGEDATAADNATAINSILAALRAYKIIAT